MTIGPLEVVFHGTTTVRTKTRVPSIRLEEFYRRSDLNTISVSQTNRGDAVLVRRSYFVYQGSEGLHGACSGLG